MRTWPARSGYGSVMPPGIVSLRRVAVGSLLAAIAIAQSPPSQRVATPPDPYTRGERAALQQAGYESLGPFPFAGGRSTTEVADLLGTEPLLWIETAHFRIGCALSPLPLKNGQEWADEWLARLKPELERLAKRLPGVKTQPKELDPWLRAHLIAQRCEDLYAEALAVLGLPEFHFPVVADDPADAASFRGIGPHFGMPNKFQVLLLRKASSHARFTRAHQQVEIADPIRYHDLEAGSMYWGAAEETGNGLFRHDWAVHAHLAFNVAHNLYTCYRSYGHDLPPWLATGLGHWHSRRISPRFPTYDRQADHDKDPRSPFWRWDTRVRGLLANGAFEPFEVLVDHTSAGAFGIEQHIMSWAVVDWLLTERKAEAGRFVHLLKDPHHARRRAPTEPELRQRQREALQAAFGQSPQQLGEAWRASLLPAKSKPKR